MRGHIRAYGSPRSWKNKCVIMVQFVGAPARHRASFATGASPKELPPTDTGQRTASSSLCTSVSQLRVPRIELPWRRHLLTLRLRLRSVHACFNTCCDRVPATGHTSGGSTPRVLNQAVNGHGSTAFASLLVEQIQHPPTSRCLPFALARASERARHVRGQKRVTTTIHLPACTTEEAAHKYGGSTRCETVVQDSPRRAATVSPRLGTQAGEYPARAQSSGARSPQHGLRARTGHHQSTHPTTTSECLTGCPRRMTRGDEQHNLRSTGPAAPAR